MSHGIPHTEYSAHFGYLETLCGTQSSGTELCCVQHTASHCNTLHHYRITCYTIVSCAAQCNPLQHDRITWYTIMAYATHCNTLQHTATLQNYVVRNTLQHCNTLQHTATNCNTLQIPVWYKIMGSCPPSARLISTRMTCCVRMRIYVYMYR